MPRISLNQLSFPNRSTLNRIGKCAGEAFICHSTFQLKVNPRRLPRPCTPRPMHCRDGPTKPFITRRFTIALCHRRDCWKSWEWMCGLWLLVIKRRGVAIVSFMLSVWPVCPAGQNDSMAFMWDFSLCWNLSGDWCRKNPRSKLHKRSCVLWAHTLITQKLN